MAEAASSSEVLDSQLGDLVAVVEFVDVGQGDSTVVIDSVGRSALIIDCPSWGVSAVRNVLRRYNIGVVHGAFVTHFDEDHFSGIPELVEEYRPQWIFANPETLMPDDTTHPKLRAALAAFVDLSERGFSEPSTSLRDSGGAMGGVSWQVLAPTTADVWKAAALKASNRNIASQVISIRVGGFTALIGGDAPIRTWNKIANERIEHLPADIFRLSHHGAYMKPGAKTIDYPTLLDLVSPQQAVVSVGSTNRYGHPVLATIHAARDAGIRVRCTEVSPACLGHAEKSERARVLRGEVDLGLPAPCSGNVRVDVFEGSWVVHPTDDAHDATIDGWTTPHCRTGCVPGQRTSVE